MDFFFVKTIHKCTFVYGFEDKTWKLNEDRKVFLRVLLAFSRRILNEFSVEFKQEFFALYC